MIAYPNMNPIALKLGPFSIYWYGVMYLVGFFGVWGLAYYRSRRSKGVWNADQVSDLIFYGALGVILGGRLGYVLFYNFSQWLHDPLYLFKIWEGGMSFHGGLLGVLTAMWWFSRKYKKTFFEVTDFIIPMVPIGLGAGRIGNFINGELWGKVTQLPWGMVFPAAGPSPRHPSQLYEFLLEGVVLFSIFWIYSRKPRITGQVSALFLVFYGVFRFLIEFVRVPDVQLGYLAFGWLTMGQLLSLPMIFFGVALFVIARTKKSVRHDPSPLQHDL